MNKINKINKINNIYIDETLMKVLNYGLPYGYYKYQYKSDFKIKINAESFDIHIEFLKDKSGLLNTIYNNFKNNTFINNNEIFLLDYNDEKINRLQIEKFINFLYDDTYDTITDLYEGITDYLISKQLDSILTTKISSALLNYCYKNSKVYIFKTRIQNTIRIYNDCDKNIDKSEIYYVNNGYNLHAGYNLYEDGYNNEGNLYSLCPNDFINKECEELLSYYQIIKKYNDVENIDLCNDPLYKPTMDMAKKYNANNCTKVYIIKSILKILKDFNIKNYDPVIPYHLYILLDDERFKQFSFVTDSYINF